LPEAPVLPDAARSGVRFSARQPERYWFSLVCPMISCAEKLMPQVGKELPTKKLSDWSG
jgi:hypothetical protein